MPVQWNNVPIDFRQGLDTKSDEKAVVPGRLTTLQNGVFTDLGAIRKRNGYTVAVGTTSDAPKGLIPHNNSLFWYGYTFFNANVNGKGGNTAPSVNVIDENNFNYVSSDYNVMPTLETEIVGDGETDRRRPAMVRFNNRLIVATELADSNVIEVHYIGENGIDDYALQNLGTTITTAVEPRLMLYKTGANERAVLVYRNSGNNNIYALFMDSTEQAFDTTGAVRINQVTPNVVPINTSTPFLWDVACAGDDYLVVVCGYTAAGVYYVEVDFSDTAGFDAGRHDQITTTAAAPGLYGLAVDRMVVSSTGHAFVMWSGVAAGHSNIYRQVYKISDQSVAAATAGVNVTDALGWASYITVTNTKIGESDTDSTGFWYFWTLNPASSITTAARVVARYFTSITAPFGGQIEQFNCQLASRAFSARGDSYVWAFLGTALQPQYVLLRGGGDWYASGLQHYGVHPHGRMFAGLARSVHSAGLPEVFRNGNQLWDTALLAAASAQVDLDAPKYVPITISTQLYGSGHDYAKLGLATLFGGGHLSFIDGKAAELGHYVYPEYLTLTPSATGGSMAVGTYNYKAVAEILDRNGELHRSAPSPSFPATTVSAISSVQCEAIANHLIGYTTEKADSLGYGRVRVIFYRTEAGGTVFYRTDAWAIVDRNVTLNSLGVSSSDIDTLVDADLIENEILYTEGGELANICPPATEILTANHDRAFLVPSDDRNAIWPSKIKQKGLAPSFSDFLTIRYNGGKITALAAMDDKIVIFTKDTIAYFSGEGPTNAGLGSFGPIRSVATSVGCADHRSVALTNDGLMFKSRAGIRLLTRDLSIPEAFGIEVADFDQYDVLDAVVFPGSDHVRFLLDGAPNNECLVYDHLVGQWSVFTNYPAIAAAVVDGTFWLALTGGTICKENTTYVDPGPADIVMKLITGWMAFNGLQGFKRVRRLGLIGTKESDHTLTIKVYYDNDDTAAQTITFDAATAITGGDDLYQLRSRLTLQKCEMIRLEIYDGTLAGTGQGFTLNNVTFEVGAKRGIRRLLAAKTV